MPPQEQAVALYGQLRYYVLQPLSKCNAFLSTGRC